MAFFPIQYNSTVLCHGPMVFEPCITSASGSPRRLRSGAGFESGGSHMDHDRRQPGKPPLAENAVGKAEWGPGASILAHRALPLRMK
jgi:hypothetical protein